MSDVTNFLDVKVGEVKDPVVLSDGLYQYVITGYKLDFENNENRTPYVMAFLRPVEVVEGDKEQDLNAAKRMTHKFYRTEAADQIASRFLVKTLGLDNKGGEAKFSELWEAAIGSEVLGVTKRKMGGKNKDRPFAEIERFFPVEA